MSTATTLQRSVKIIATIGFFLFGRYAVSRLVSKRGGKKLKWVPLDHDCYVKCPSGNIWYAGFEGPEDAQPLVFIHGLNANHEQWYYQRQHFNEKYRLIFLDLPIHTDEAADLSMATLAADLNNILQHFNIKDAIIYGHSMGGTMLVEYGTRFTPSENVKGIIIQGGSYTNPVMTNKLTWMLAPLQKSFVIPTLNVVKKNKRVFQVLSRINYRNGSSSIFYRPLFFTGNQTAAELRYIVSMAPDCSTDTIAEGLLQMIKFDATDRLANIKIPVLIISAKRDVLNTVKCGEYMARNIELSRHKIVEEGHQCIIENYYVINAAIEEFAISLVA